jgi:hypothetical protein
MTIAASLALFAGAVTLVSGCDADGVGLDCGKSTCHVAIHSGDSIRIGNLVFFVAHVDSDYVTLSSHAMTVKVEKDLDVTIGRYHLHLAGASKGAASLDVSR